MRKSALASLPALALLLTSCGGAAAPDSPDGTGTADGPGASPTSTATQVPTTPADDAPGGNGGSGDGGGGDGNDDGASASCGITESWTLSADVDPGSSGAPVRDVRAGRHECFDRVVVDVHGTAATGFDVSYVPEVKAQGSGKPVPVAGNAALRMIVRSPAQGTPGGGTDQEPLASVGEHFVPEDGLADWGSLRSVRFAGSFEGQTTVALGAREKLPFRAFARLDEDRDVRTVVVDIAHSPN
ncbi:AMIN-like domain-containing (lipo)protein [Streptomonospora litoralis]|uniref:AMIN-like domain-containing protein n=1 Tax=Streptomonospora litoralis TaxID=2498135 RepID=A0A4P6Q6S5_9ACTN|nr:hypothetical protein [Streptomonospora litoralis]QBI56435.1 hypothetical protein EKD16_23435 [Streptomonospora litoralis]